MVFILPVADVVGGIRAAFSVAPDIKGGRVLGAGKLIFVGIAVGVEEFTSGVG